MTNIHQVSYLGVILLRLVHGFLTIILNNLAVINEQASLYITASEKRKFFDANENNISIKKLR